MLALLVSASSSVWAQSAAPVVRLTPLDGSAAVEGTWLGRRGDTLLVLAGGDTVRRIDAALQRREVRDERTRRSLLWSGAKWGALAGAVGGVVVLRDAIGSDDPGLGGLLYPVVAASGAAYGALLGLGGGALWPRGGWREFPAGGVPAP